MWNVFEVKSIDQCFLIVFIMMSMYYDIPHCYIFNSLPHWNFFYLDIILRPRRVFFCLDRHEFIFERHIFTLISFFYRDAWHLLIIDVLFMWRNISFVRFLYYCYVTFCTLRINYYHLTKHFISWYKFPAMKADSLRLVIITILANDLVGLTAVWTHKFP